VDQQCFLNADIEQGVKILLKSSGGEFECRKRSDVATQALIVTVRKLYTSINYQLDALIIIY